jgi:large subunit ribosomal protein L17
MRRNLTASLFEHETISTTIEKAKEIKPFAEKLISLAREGTLSARRRAISLLGNRDIINEEEGKRGTVIGKLFSEIGPRYLDRPGGYTRIIRLSLKRLGDNGQLVLLQLVGVTEEGGKAAKAGKKRSRRRQKSAAKEAEEAAETEQPEQSEDNVEAEPVSEEKAADEHDRTEENGGNDRPSSDQQKQAEQKG